MMMTGTRGEQQERREKRGGWKEVEEKRKGPGSRREEERFEKRTVGKVARGDTGGMGERVNGLPRPCEPPDHTGRAATTRPLQHPSNGSDLPSNRQTARLPDSYLTDRSLAPGRFSLLSADSS